MNAPTDPFELPLFDPAHRELAQRLSPWAGAQSIHVQPDTAHRDWRAVCAVQGCGQLP